MVISKDNRNTSNIISDTMGIKKNFVLDTNVILHDSKCIRNFQEHDIYVPIVVLEELARFKKGNEELNFNAREFAREIDTIADSHLFKDGASLGKGRGRLFVVTEENYPEELAKAFSERIPEERGDNRFSQPRRNSHSGS